MRILVLLLLHALTAATAKERCAFMADVQQAISSIPTSDVSTRTYDVSALTMWQVCGEDLYACTNNDQGGSPFKSCQMKDCKKVTDLGFGQWDWWSLGDGTISGPGNHFSSTPLAQLDAHRSGWNLTRSWPNAHVRPIRRSERTTLCSRAAIWHLLRHGVEHPEQVQGDPSPSL